MEPQHDAEYDVDWAPDHRLSSDILVEVVEYGDLSWQRWDWNGWAAEVIDYTRGGAAEYEDSFGAGMGWVIETHLTCPKRLGFFVAEGMTTMFHEDYYGEVDADHEFDFEHMRPATPEEIAAAFGTDWWATGD